MKIYVVISDPGYYKHYEKVFLTLDEARKYVTDFEFADKVTKLWHLYGQQYFDTGHWVEENDTLCWCYPNGGGYTHGIRTEELGGQ